jgi:hypothetical protein
MKREIIFMLDALNSTAEKLILLQSMVNTEREINALKSVMSLAVEYITQLNLLLLKTVEELRMEQFKSRLIMDAVGLFIGEVQDLRVILDQNKLMKASGAN